MNSKRLPFPSSTLWSILNGAFKAGQITKLNRALSYCCISYKNMHLGGNETPFYLEFNRYHHISFSEQVRFFPPLCTLSMEGLIHKERQYPNYRKSLCILFQHRGLCEAPWTCSVVLTGLLFLSFNGVHLRVEFYYMHLKNVELKFQRGRLRGDLSQGGTLTPWPLKLTALRHYCLTEGRPFGTRRETRWLPGVSF